MSPAPEIEPSAPLPPSKLALLVVGLVALAAGGLKLGAVLSGTKATPAASGGALAASATPAIVVVPTASVPLEVPAPSASLGVAPSASVAPRKPKPARVAPTPPITMSDFGGRR